MQASRKDYEGEYFKGLYAQGAEMVESFLGLKVRNTESSAIAVEPNNGWNSREVSIHIVDTKCILCIIWRLL